MAGPISPQEYGDGMNDTELDEAGWAVGLDVWGPVEKAYADFVGGGTLANSQLWSLDQAIRADERRRHGVEGSP
jgi:hypothetical protein